MERFKMPVLLGVLSFLVMTGIIFQNISGLVFAGQKPVKVTTKIKHKPIKYFVPEHRIKMTAKVKDKNGVNLVRCYFKAEGQANFVFVPMNNESTATYMGVLPAPSKNTNAIEYLLLVVNGKNAVVKSQTFTVNKEDDKQEVPPWQEVSSEGDITVSTEIPGTTEPPKGFADNITMDVVESTSRFGSSAGIYPLLPASEGGPTGAAASVNVQGRGTVVASTGVVSVTTAVIGGVAIAGAIGVGAAASSSDSSSSNDNNGVIDDIIGLAIINRIINCPFRRSGGFSEEVQFFGPFDLGQSTGTFNFLYDTANCPDSFTIKQNGNIIGETDCVINEEGNLQLTLEGTSERITVEVLAGCLLPEAGFNERQPESVWNFVVECPN